METPSVHDQLTKVRNLLHVVTRTVVPKVAEKYQDPQKVLKVLDGRSDVFARRMELAFEQVLNEMLDLVPQGVRTVTLESGHNPKNYYGTRDDLQVSPEFQQQVVANAGETEHRTEFKVNSVILERHMWDMEIESGLPAEHCYDEKTVCAVIAALLDHEREGGPVLSGGNAFYLKSAVVYVGRDYKKVWHLAASPRGIVPHRAGSQLFFPVA